MNILITGGSGFLGRDLTAYLQQTGVNITWVSRRVSTTAPDAVNVINYEQLKTSDAVFDVIINLAGAGIANKRWSDARKQVLYDSRMNPTQAVLEYLAQTSRKPRLFISSSAIGWYGVQNSAVILTEDGPVHDEYQHQLCAAWEARARQAEALDVPTVIIRTGIVIAPNGGMVGRLRLPFSLGLGGRLGSGEQILSWISQHDWTRAVAFIIDTHLNNSAEKPRLFATYNLTNDSPISNAIFTRAMGKWLSRPTLFSQPRKVIEWLFGEMSVLLIGGQTVMPSALLASNFQFAHRDIDAVLAGK